MRLIDRVRVRVEVRVRVTQFSSRRRLSLAPSVLVCPLDPDCSAGGLNSGRSARSARRAILESCERYAVRGGLCVACQGRDSRYMHAFDVILSTGILGRSTSRHVATVCPTLRQAGCIATMMLPFRNARSRHVENK